MNRYKYLAKNIITLTISNFTSKLLSFFLVPLYTSILSTSEYGIYDMFTTTIYILIPILTMDILESVLRFSMNQDTDLTSILSSSWKIVSYGLAAIIAAVIINRQFHLNAILSEFGFYFILLYLVCSFSGIITSFVRGTGHITALSIAGILSSIISLSLNILLLLVVHAGLKGYFIASISGTFVQCLYLFLKCNMRKYLRIRRANQKELSVRKEMLHYSRPMVINSIGWWINNASDRYIVIWMCGLAENGIYSVSYKIPSILSIFQSIFDQAWVLSAVKDYDPKDQNGYFSKLYNTYNCCLVILCSILISLDKTLAGLLYANDFYNAWKYVPFLTMAVIFSALSGYIGGIFAAVKDSVIYAKSTVAGAVINTLLNILLVYNMGPTGAALATLISYWTVWLIRLTQVRKYIRFKKYILRDSLSYLILILQSILIQAELYQKGIIIANGLLFSVLLVLYFREIQNIFRFGIEKFKTLKEKG